MNLRMDHFRGTREGLGADGNGAWNDRAEPWTAKAIVRCFVTGLIEPSACGCGFVSTDGI